MDQIWLQISSPRGSFSGTAFGPCFGTIFGPKTAPNGTPNGAQGAPKSDPKTIQNSDPKMDPKRSRKGPPEGPQNGPQRAPNRLGRVPWEGAPASGRPPGRSRGPPRPPGAPRDPKMEPKGAPDGLLKAPGDPEMTEKCAEGGPKTKNGPGNPEVCGRLLVRAAPAWDRHHAQPALARARPRGGLPVVLVPGLSDLLRRQLPRRPPGQQGRAGQFSLAEQLGAVGPKAGRDGGNLPTKRRLRNG